MKDWKLTNGSEGLAVTPGTVTITLLDTPSRAEFDTLASLVDTLTKRVSEQACTIETLSKRIDQVEHKPSLLINGKPLHDCTAEEIDQALSRLMFRP